MKDNIVMLIGFGAILMISLTNFYLLGQNLHGFDSFSDFKEDAKKLDEKIAAYMNVKPNIIEKHVESRLGLKESDYFKMLQRTEDKIKSLETELLEAYNKKQKKLTKSLSNLSPDIETIEKAAKFKKEEGSFKIVNNYKQLKSTLTEVYNTYFELSEESNDKNNQLTKFNKYIERYEEEDKSLPNFVNSIAEEFSVLSDTISNYEKESQDLQIVYNSFKSKLNITEFQTKSNEFESKIESIIKQN